MADNPLVAAPQDDGKVLAGAGPLDTGEDMFNNVNNVFEEGKQVDPVALGIDSVAMGLDVAGAIADPFGTLASSVVGWIIENVGPIRKPFDDLAGDPPRIDAASETWKNISEQLQTLSQDHKGRVDKDLVEWTEQAADGYRKQAGQFAELLAASSNASASVAQKVKTAGAIVAATRSLLRDLLAELAGTLIVWGIPAMASAVPTFGASVAAFTVRAVTKAIEVGSTIAQYLSKLFKALDKLGGLARSAGESMRRMTDMTGFLGRSMRSAPGGFPDSGTLTEGMGTLAQGAGRLGARGMDGAASGLDSAARRMDDVATSTSRWADDVAAGGADRASSVRNVLDGGGHAAPGTRSGDMPDPTTPAGRVDDVAGKGILDGQNWARAARTGDIGHLQPQWGDLIDPAKETAKEVNKAHWQSEEEKATDEQDRTGRGLIWPAEDSTSGR